MEIPNRYYRVTIKALIQNEDGKFLLIREKPDKYDYEWDLPGGGLDFGETVEQCLKREIQEEINLNIDTIEENPSYFLIYVHHARNRVNVIYRTILKDYNFTPTEECFEIKFFTVEEVLNNKEKMFPNVLEFVKIYQNKTISQPTDKSKKEYTKDFEKWNILKKEIDKKEISQNTFFNEREIWWGSLGVNIGFEQDGKNDQFERPLLIVKKFNRSIVWAVPLTSVAKDNKFHYRLKSSGSFIILSQIRLVSTKRLFRLIETINENEFKKIITQIKNFLP
jgi:8-oxo-dGTP diphosphatase